MVTGRAEQRSVVAGFERRLRSIGIQATIGKCDWMGLVAEGVKGGNLSYGAACRVRIASRSPADFLICEASLGGNSLTKPDVYSWGADYRDFRIFAKITTGRVRPYCVGRGASPSPIPRC